MVFSSPKTREGISHALEGGNNYWWLLAAGLMAGVAPVCATVRLWLLLRVQDILLPLRRVTQLYMIGMFFNLFLPGSTGGDAVKFFYLLRENPDPGSAPAHSWRSSWTGCSVSWRWRSCRSPSWWRGIPG